MEDKYMYNYESKRRVLDVAPRFNNELTANTGLAAMFAKLQIQTDDAGQSLILLDTSTKAHTKAGIAIKEKAALSFSIGASIATGYGNGNQIDDLKDLSEFTYSALIECSTVNQNTHSQKILDVIGGYATELANNGLDAAFTTLLHDDLHQLETLSKVPKNMIEAHKNTKIMFVKNLADSDKFEEEELDKTMQLYRIRNMAFYLAYTAARKARHHHTKRKFIAPDAETTTGILELMLLFKDTMEPAAGASFVVALLNISTTADEDGETYNDGLKPGTYHGQISMDGYKTIEFDFTIEAGKTCDLQFLLEKV